MAIYEMIKDAASLVRKMDNIDLYKKLLDIGEQALDLQNENANLKKEIERLNDIKKIEEDIQPQIEPYFTLKSDKDVINRYFCTTCWAREKTTIQMYYDGDRKLMCPSCKTRFSITPKKRVQSIYY